MTDPTRRPQAPGRDGQPPRDDPVDFEPQERAMLEQAVQPVAKRGRGPTFTIALVVLAFVLGVVRPWDWLPSGGAASDARPGGEAAASGPPVTGSGDAGGTGATPAGPTPTPAPGSEAAAAQVCAYPQGWRSSTLQNYAGRRALVWTAVEAVRATGPLDPSIPFEGIAGDTFTAIGWCAPVDGPDRPPDGTTARLFRVADGRATPEPYVRLHPAAPNPLGELWGPVGSPVAASPGPGATPAASGPVASPADGTGLPPGPSLGVGETAPTWAPGRYLIELEAPGSDYVRWLGLDIRLSQPVVEPGSTPPAPVKPTAPASPSPAP